MSRSWSVAPLSLIVAIAAGTLLSNGVSFANCVGYITYWTFVILLPGLVVWNLVWSRVLRESPMSGERTWLENFVCGAVVGYALELPAYAVARWVGAPRAYVALEASILVGWFLKTRPWRSRATQLRRHGSFAASVGMLGVLSYTCVWLGLRALPSASLSPDGRFADLDDPFQLALIGELRHHFPAVYPYAIEEPLNYQYFYHLHAAASTWLTGISSLEVFVRFDPLIFALLSVAGAACVAHRVVGEAWAGVLASGTLVLLGAFDITGIYRGQATFEDRFLSTLLIHSPTQAMAFALVTPLALIALAVVESGRAGVAGLIAFFVLSFVITGAKVTFAPMILAALIGVWVLSMLRRRKAQGAPLLAAGAAAAVVSCVALLFGTGGRGLTIAPLSIAEWYGAGYGITHGTLRSDLLIVGLLVVSVLVPVAGVLGFSRATLDDPRSWFLVLMGLAGVGAMAIFGHGGLSQRYFLYSSAWSLSIASAWGLERLFQRVPREKLVAYSGGALIAGLAIFGVRLLAEAHSEISVSAGGQTSVRPGFPGWLSVPLLAVAAMLIVALARVIGRPRLGRRLLVVGLVGSCLARPIALAVSNVEDVTVARASASASAEGILSWLRTYTDPADIVMTNAHCLEETATTPLRCDNRHFWMSALSERRFLLEGWGYIERLAANFYAPYGGDRQFLAEHDRQFTDPSRAALEHFVDRYEVVWILVDRSGSADLPGLEASGAEPVIVAEDYALLRAPQQTR